MTDPPPAHGCTINGQPAIPIPVSDYNQLAADLAALRAVARGYCPHCGRGDAAPSVEDWEQQKQRADQAERLLRRYVDLADITHKYPIMGGHDCIGENHTCAGCALRDEARAALEQPAPRPATTQATEQEKTTRVLAALHRSAEQDVSRVIDLYERWVKAGPPPLGASMARWWDARLAELHDAIRPPEPQE